MNVALSPEEPGRTARTSLAPQARFSARPSGTFVARVHPEVWIGWGSVAFAAALLLGAVVQPWVDPAELLRDTLAVAERSNACCKVHYGFISTLGVLLWSACSAICLFAAALAFFGRARREGVYLLSAGLFSGFLAFDDMFLVHENIIPAFGLSENAVYLVYAGVGVGYLVHAWPQIRAGHFGLLATALALLVTSLLIDVVTSAPALTRLVAEDGAKFIGITAWTAFHVLAAWRIVTQLPRFGTASGSRR